MKIKLPWFKRKQQGYDIDYLIIDGGGALAIGATLIFFPEPIVTTSLGVAVGLFTAGYKFIKNRSKIKIQEKILLEIRKIKYGIYVLLLATLVGAVCIIFSKVIGMIAGPFYDLPTYTKLLGTLAMVIILFICFVVLGSVASEEKGG